MIQGHIFLVILLMLIGATVLWTFITSSNTKWIIKASLTTLMLFAILSAWIGLRSIYGYPYDHWPNNEKYIMVGSYVEEPEIKEPDSGAIYLWLIENNPQAKKSWVDTIAHVINGRQPRVYVIQYNRQMHEEIAGLEKKRKGNPIPITFMNEEQGRKQMKSHGGERSDDSKYEPYIFPDMISIIKTTQ